MQLMMLGCRAIKIGRTKELHKWQAVQDKRIALAKNPSRATLQGILTTVNGIILYKREPLGSDHWQTPLETINKGTGDCEDFAILYRAYALAWGVATDANMFLLIGYDNVARSHHAVTAVLQNGEWLFLDCLAQKVLTENSLRGTFKPLFAYNGTTSYIFSEPQGKAV